MISDAQSFTRGHEILLMKAKNLPWDRRGFRFSVTHNRHVTRKRSIEAGLPRREGVRRLGLHGSLKIEYPIPSLDPIVGPKASVYTNEPNFMV